MKILLVHNYYQQRGGEDSVFESEAALLKSYGHDVQTLVFHNDTIQSGWQKLQTGLYSINNLSSTKQLENILNSFRPDVMHTHNFFPLASPGIFKTARQAGVPTVLTLHNYRLICANGLLFRGGRPCEDCVSQAFPLDGILHKCYRNSALQSAAVTGAIATHRLLKTWHQDVDHYIALTDFSRQKFLDSALRLPAEKVSIKPNFIDDPGYAPDKRENFMLYVGRLVPEKGILTLLDVWQHLKLPLKIAGTGPLEEYVRKAAENNPHIEYLGFQPRENVLTLMQQAYALLFTSTWYEGFPVTLLEALATGTPVICSETGGLPEIIRNRQHGLLFPPGEKQPLLSCIETLQQNPELHRQFSRQARNHYLANYTPAASYQQLIEIYESLQTV